MFFKVFGANNLQVKRVEKTLDPEDFIVPKTVKEEIGTILVAQKKKSEHKLTFFYAADSNRKFVIKLISG
jgi:hypothetical protein